MSENIESNVIDKKAHGKGYGNSSTKGKQREDVSNIARNGKGEFVQTEKESSYGALSHVAVVRQKIPLQNDDKHVQAFKTAYDVLFAEF